MLVYTDCERVRRLSDCLNRIRGRYRYSIADLSRMTGLSYPTILRFLRGRKPVSESTVLVLEHFTRVVMQEPSS